MTVTNRLAYLNTYYIVDLLAAENVNMTVDHDFLSLLTYCGEFLDTILDGFPTVLLSVAEVKSDSSCTFFTFPELTYGEITITEFKPLAFGFGFFACYEVLNLGSP